MTSIRLVPVECPLVRSLRSLNPHKSTRDKSRVVAIEHTSEKGNAGLSKAASIRQAIVTPVLQLQHEQACVAAYTGVRYADHSGPCTLVSSLLIGHRLVCQGLLERAIGLLPSTEGSDWSSIRVALSRIVKPSMFTVH